MLKRWVLRQMEFGCELSLCGHGFPILRPFSRNKSPRLLGPTLCSYVRSGLVRNRSVTCMTWSLNILFSLHYRAILDSRVWVDQPLTNFVSCLCWLWLVRGLGSCRGRIQVLWANNKGSWLVSLVFRQPGLEMMTTALFFRGAQLRMKQRILLMEMILPLWWRRWSAWGSTGWILSMKLLGLLSRLQLHQLFKQPGTLWIIRTRHLSIASWGSNRNKLTGGARKVFAGSSWVLTTPSMWSSQIISSRWARELERGPSSSWITGIRGCRALFRDGLWMRSSPTLTRRSTSCKMPTWCARLQVDTIATSSCSRPWTISS